MVDQQPENLVRRIKRIELQMDFLHEMIKSFTQRDMDRIEFHKLQFNFTLHSPVIFSVKNLGSSSVPMIELWGHFDDCTPSSLDSWDQASFCLV